MRKRDILHIARTTGKIHGRAAVNWYKMPETVDEAQAVLTGLDSHDPAIVDNLPKPDLDGSEDASYAAVDLMEDLELNVGTPAQERRYRKLFPLASDEYEKAFTDAVTLSVWKYCTDLIQKIKNLEKSYPKDARYSADEFPGVAIKIVEWVDAHYVLVSIGSSDQRFGMLAERLTILDEGTYDPETGQIAGEEW